MADDAQFQVAWGDLDANGHMANRAYFDNATQTRFLYIAARGFTPADFREHALGPEIHADGAWFDLRARKITTPPDKLARLMRESPSIGED